MCNVLLLILLLLMCIIISNVILMCNINDNENIIINV